MPKDDFFNASYCQRCGQDTGAYTMSWFINIRICMECADVEDTLKEAMRRKGMNPGDYEGCGYIPKITS
jgi:hypothetical protein